MSPERFLAGAVLLVLVAAGAQRLGLRPERPADAALVWLGGMLFQAVTRWLP